MSTNNTHGADLSNWRSRPYSVYAFSHTNDVLRTSSVDVNKSDAMELPSSPKSFDDFQIRILDGSQIGMEEFLKLTDTDGFVILQDGKVIYEHYDNGNTAETPHIIMSATKSVVGILLGILYEKGIVDLDTPVSKYVPEISNTCYQGVTLRQLIDMRTGVKVEDWGHDYRAAMGWEPPQETDRYSNLYDYLAALPEDSDPHGGAMKYLSHNTDLVGWVLERAAGKQLADLISELIWKPMGAASDAYMTVDSKGNARGAGGLCTSTRDLARLGQLILDDGRRGERQIIPRSWIEDMEKNGDHEAWNQGAWAPLFGALYKSMSYRSAWIVIDDDPNLIFAWGIHGQNLFIDRKNRIVIAKTSSQHDATDRKQVGLTHLAVRSLQRYLG